MTAGVTPQTTTPRLRDLVQYVLTWVKSHFVSVVTAAIVGTIIGFIANVWLLAFAYGGYEKVPPGGPAPGTGNEILGTVFWVLISTVVFGAYGYFRAVGPAGFAASIRSRPDAVRGLFTGAGNRALAALLWGAMLSLLVTVVVGPAIGAVLGVGIFATAFGFIGRMLTIALMRLVTAILKIVQPASTAKPTPAAVTAGIVGGSLAMVVEFVLPTDPYGSIVNLRLILAIACGLAALVLSRPTSGPGPTIWIVGLVGGLAALELLHPAVAFALDGGDFECGGLGFVNYVFQPCPGKELVTILAGVGGVGAGFGAIPGLAIGNLLGTNPNWGPGIVPDDVRGGAPGEQAPGQPGDDYTEVITDAQGNVQRTVTHHTDPVTGDVTVTTTNSQGNVINTITTHVDPISGDTTITRTNSQGNPVVSQVTHVDPLTGATTVTVSNAQGTPVRTTITSTNPVTGDTTVTVLNPQNNPIRTSTTHVDPLSGDTTTVVTNPQGSPIETFTTHTDPISGDTTRTILNPQNQPVRTVIDHVDPVTGDATRTTLNPQGTAITTQTWHTDPVSGDTTQTIKNVDGTPIRTLIEHTDPVSGDTTRTVLNPQGSPIRTEIDHTDPVSGDTTVTVLNPQGSPIRTVIDHTDPITGDVTKTTLNPQNQPIRTDVWHTNPTNGDEIHSSYNPQGQPIGTEIYHQDPVTGDTSVTVLNEQGSVEHTYTVHRDPITGLWVPDTSTGSGLGDPADGGSAMATGAATVGQGLSGGTGSVGGGLTGGSTGGAAGGGGGAPGGGGTSPGTTAGPAPTPEQGSGEGQAATPGPSTDQGSGESTSQPVTPPEKPTPQTGEGQADDGTPDPVDDFFQELTPDDFDPIGEAGGPPSDAGSPGVDTGTPPSPAPDEPKADAPPPPPTSNLDNLTSLGPTDVPADKAFETIHDLIPEVGKDGTVGPVTLKDPRFENGGVTVETPVGPATAKFGIDDKGHLTAEITDMPTDPTGVFLPSKDEASQNVQKSLDDFNRQLDDKGVKLTDVRTEGGHLILTKGPIGGPPPVQ